MKRTTKKVLIIVGALLIVAFLGLSTHKDIQYDKGHSQNYSLSKTDEKQKNGILVFCYHRLLKNTPGVRFSQTFSRNSQLHDFNVPANQFASQMKFLHDHHIKVISGTQMCRMVKSRHPIHGKYAVLSFDDIDRTTVDNAIPVMLKYHFPFTTFIITGNTGRYREGTQLATWSQIKRAKQRSGNLMTVGLHTNNMHYLTKKLVPIFDLTHNYHRFTVDFHTSRKRLHQEMGTYGHEFAYPYGGGNNFTDNFLDKQKLNWIATLSGGVINQQTDLNQTPRMIINNNSWPSIRHWYETK